MGHLRMKSLLLLLVAGLTAPQRVVSQSPSPPVYRLPSTVTPLVYMIQLDPDMDTGVITGSIRIEVQTTSDETQTLDSITMHMGKDVVVNETTAAILDMSGSVQPIGAVTSDDVNTLLVLQLPDGQTLSYNHMYVINLCFQSVLNTNSKGLFTGYYNATSKYVASNLRPASARDVFPCFDEPHFKVPVNLQVWRPASHYAISMAPLAYSSNATADNKVLDSFANTEPISIHSLGLFIGQQPAMEAMGVKVVVPSDLPTSVPYLNNIISTMVKWIGPFPHSPLYVIVLPDMTYSSYSGYGFVFTSPEVYLGKIGSALQWTSLQLKLTEEFLRQYLEYSKTPQWWSDIWLSESIGAFLSLPLQQNEPWLRDWLNIVIRSKALGSYIGESAPVISNPDLTKWDVENIISHQVVKFKGLSTLLMWENTMPEGLVLETLMEFIKLPQSVVSTTDLVTLMVNNIYKANTTYDVTPAIPLLPNWLAQPGSPLVWFNIDSDSTFSLIQGTPCSAGPAPALRSISVAVAEGSTPLWNITRQGLWLLNTSSQFTFINVSESSVINIENAPYRVNYLVSQWSTLQTDVAAGWAPAAVASTLQDDAVALSFAGCLNFSVALSLLNGSQHAGLDWYPVVKATEAITANIADDPWGFAAYSEYLATLFTPDLLSALDLRNSSSHPELSVARELVTPLLCHFNISTCREAVVELGGLLWQGNTSGIAGSDLESVACYGARYTPGALGALLDAYVNAESVWIRRYFAIGLSCLTDQDSVNQLLTIITGSNTTWNAKDARRILTGLASQLENTQVVSSFLVNQSAEIQAKFGVNTLSTVIKSLAKNRVNLSQLSALLADPDLDPFVLQSVSEALMASNSSQLWYSNNIYRLYQDLPGGGGYTTTTSTTTPRTTSTPKTPTTPTSPPPTPTPTPTGAPGAAYAVSGCGVFVLVLALAALLTSLDLTKQ